MPEFTKSMLESIYKKYNRQKFIYPDPLWFLYNYKNKEDIETAGLIASSLAYGNIKIIMKSAGIILDFLGRNPASALDMAEDDFLLKNTAGFVHRFAKSANITGLLKSIREIRHKYGSLENCFLAGYNKKHKNILDAAQHFAALIHEKAYPFEPGHLIAKPEKKSSCKRLNLFFRWMVRNDEVDPGWWNISPSKLIIPLDTHMHRISLEYGLTRKKGTGINTALEITEKFKFFSKDDPVKYDFALTREGIRG